ncbi:MAG TPA: hypothetical protein VKC53_01155 [Patescibacteria group bacterium]|nr:hypothetical protein [Patescibacteria group bacterium]
MTKKIAYILSFLIIIFLFIFPFFIKVKIECKSQFGECPEELNSKLRISNSKNLFVAKRETVKVLKNLQLVSDFSTQFKLPNTILVNIISKKPYFAIKNISSGVFDLVDKNGVVLSQSTSSNLPAVFTSEPLKKVSEPIEDYNLFASHLMFGINQMYQVLYGTIENDALVVDMPTGVRVIFPIRSESEPEVLLGAFRLIYTKVTTDYLGTYSQIDMRYKNPVLRIVQE